MAKVTIDLGTIPERAIVVATCQVTGRVTITFGPEGANDIRHALGEEKSPRMVWTIPPAVLAAIKAAV